MTKKPFKAFISFLKDIKEILGLIVFFAAPIPFIIKQAQPSPGPIDDNFILVITVLLNIVALVIFFFAIKPSPLTIEGNEVKNLKNHLYINDDKDYQDNLKRVNELIKQLVYCVKLFVVILAVFYCLQFAIEYFHPIPYDNCDPKDPESLCVKKIITDKHNIRQILDSGQMVGDTIGYLLLEFLTNTANLFSAAYLFLAFQVLFVVTVENDDKTWRLKGVVPMSLAIFITILNLYCFTAGVPNTNLLVISHMFRLAGGIYNGVAMFLLFSRFISMEYFFKNSSNWWQRNFYFYGTIIVLPLYVVAQPLYGLFNAIEIGKSPELFKSVVFLICFWGKLVFLLFIFTMLTKKWIHSYLFMVLSQEETLLKISKDLRDVEDL